jgi:hypothetical protein
MQEWGKSGVDWQPGTFLAVAQELHKSLMDWLKGWAKLMQGFGDVENGDRGVMGAKNS